MGRAALATCAHLLPAYVACAEAHLTRRQREIVLAPQVYREQSAPAAAAAATTTASAQG